MNGETEKGDLTMIRLLSVLSTMLLLGSFSVGYTQTSQSQTMPQTLPIPQQTAAQVTREDFSVTSDPTVQLFVRAVKPATNSTQTPILLLHGGGGGGIASYDVNVLGYSLAETFASAGHPTYLMSVRGWERSTRPAGLDQAANANPPLVQSEEAVRDISAVVDSIQQRHRNQTVALVGHASGGHWAGMYTSRNSAKVSALVMLNSLYGVDAPWELRQTFERKERPGQFNLDGAAYREVTVEGLIANWSSNIPVEDKTQWRDLAVAQAYQTLTFENDPTSATRQPPSVRIPGGFRLDAYNLSRGQKLWNAADIQVPTLFIRGDRDHWSRQADLQALDAELVNAPRKKLVTIPNGTHFLFLDRPERGRDRFVQEVLSFLE
jgi:pimeloyl-ACP methyl ester carboxylesterase